MNDLETRLFARLDAMDAKLDYVVARQKYTEELVREMTPVAREAMGAMAAKMQTWEERGWFAMGHEMVAMFDTLATTYGAEDVQEFSTHVVQIVDTVRNLTQPDVLDFANDATDVLHHADDVKPMGPMAAVKATTDADVRRGMAVALEILRHLGQASGGAGATPRAAKAPATPKKPKAPVAPQPDAAPKPAPVTAKSAAQTAKGEAPEEVVEWQGRQFTTEGFLVDPHAWDDALATAMAAGLGLTLTEDHWVAIRWARADFLAHGAAPNVRRVATGSGLGTKKLYVLFPGTPGKSVAMVAGIPKPVGCV